MLNISIMVVGQRSRKSNKSGGLFNEPGEKMNQKLAIVTNLVKHTEYPYLLDYEPNTALIKTHQMQGGFKAINLRLNFDLAKNIMYIFILTGRSPDEEAATIKNLNQAGITGWTGIYF